MDIPPNYDLTDNLPLLDEKMVENFFVDLALKDNKDSPVDDKAADGVVPMDQDDDDPSDSETEVVVELRKLNI